MHAMIAGLSATIRMTKQLLGNDDEAVVTTDHRLFSSMPSSMPQPIGQLTGHVFVVYRMCLWFLCVDGLFVDTLRMFFLSIMASCVEMKSHSIL